MKPRLKGSKWEITYKIPGYKKAFSERFDTIEEANFRIAEIEVLKKNEKLRPPQCGRVDTLINLADFLDVFIKAYAIDNWSASYYSGAINRIEKYIKPQIGDILLRDIDPPFLESYYKKLLKTPGIKRIGVHEELISVNVVERIHVILRCALSQAVRWGYLQYNPAMAVKPPKHKKKTRDVWTAEEARIAINECDNEILRLAMMLSIGCSMRLGEILGLQWNNVFITEDSIKNGDSFLIVSQELKRCEIDVLETLRLKERGDIFFEFPMFNETAKSVMVLKCPKTESSRRKVFIPNAVARVLLETKAKQEKQKEACHGLYEDYNLVIAFENGRPCEQRNIGVYMRRLFKKTGLRPVVFHSLRHLSTSIKLQLSNGDVKAVQGDTGHSQSAMVLDVYAHTFDANRQELANKVNASFFNQLR